MENSRIRQKAWTILKENLRYYFKGGVPYILFGILIMLTFFGWFFRMVSSMLRIPQEDAFFQVGGFLLGMILFMLIVAIAGGLLYYGYQIYLLRLIRHGETEMKNALTGFSSDGFRFLVVAFVVGLLIAAVTGITQYLFEDGNLEAIGGILVTFLSLITGLVTWLFPFLVHDHSEWSIPQIPVKAWEAMRGRKWKYFTLQVPVILLAFAGILLLVLLGVFMLLPVFRGGPGTAVPDDSFGVVFLIWLLYMLFSLLLTFYFTTLSIVFYESVIRQPDADEPYYSVDYPDA